MVKAFGGRPSEKALDEPWNEVVPYVQERDFRRRDIALKKRVEGLNSAHDIFCPGLDMARDRAEGCLELEKQIWINEVRRSTVGKYDARENEHLIDFNLSLYRALKAEGRGNLPAWPHDDALAEYATHLTIESSLPLIAIAYLAWWEGWLIRTSAPGAESVRSLKRLMSRHWQKQNCEGGPT